MKTFTAELEDGVTVTAPHDRVVRALLRDLSAPPAVSMIHGESLRTMAPYLPGVPRIGEVWAGQGGRVGGVVRGSNGKPDSILILPTDERAFFTDVNWGPRGVEVPGARDDWDGAANTLAMLKAKCPLAQVISALEIEGHKDFYLMARRQAPILYANLPEILGEFGWTWTSTEASSYSAWCQLFNNGPQSYSNKDDDFRAFAVRSVPLPNLVL